MSALLVFEHARRIPSADVKAAHQQANKSYG
jgi:hypothetical protein